MECPYVDREIEPNPEFNTPVPYETQDGNTYIFYRHWDGIDQTYNCQFCKLIGRKRDVFECLNENEWKECIHYKLAIKRFIDRHYDIALPIMKKIYLDK